MLRRKRRLASLAGASHREILEPSDREGRENPEKSLDKAQ